MSIKAWPLSSEYNGYEAMLFRIFGGADRRIQCGDQVMDLLQPHIFLTDKDIVPLAELAFDQMP